MPSVNIFLSYAHKDFDALKSVIAKLSSLLKSITFRGQRYKIVYHWDQRITPGHEWNQTILQQIEAADIIVFFVSHNFLKSEFIQKYEIPKSLERSENSGIHLLPILIEQCPYRESEISHLQFIPYSNGSLKPLSEWKNKTVFWENTKFALTLAIKNSLAHHPNARFFDPSILTPAERNKHISLFSSAEFKRLERSVRRRRTRKRKTTLASRIRNSLKRILKAINLI